MPPRLSVPDSQLGSNTRLPRPLVLPTTEHSDGPVAISLPQVLLYRRPVPGLAPCQLTLAIFFLASSERPAPRNKAYPRLKHGHRPGPQSWHAADKRSQKAPAPGTNSLTLFREKLNSVTLIHQWPPFREELFLSSHTLLGALSRREHNRSWQTLRPEMITSMKPTSSRPSDPRIKKKALALLQIIDRSHPAFADIDFSTHDDTLLSILAARTRAHVRTIPVQSIDLDEPYWPRIAKPNEYPEELIERCLTNRWVSVGREYHFPNGLDYNCSPSPSLNTAGFPFGEWTWQLNRHHEWEVAARLYHQTGQPRYAAAIAQWLETWILQCPRPVEDLSLHQASWRTIEIGLRLGSIWPQVLSAFKDATEIDDLLWLAWLNVYEEQAEFVQRYRKENNWLLMEMNGLLHAAVQLPYFKNSKAWEHTAISSFIDEIGTQFHADGFQRELSTHYMSTCVDNYLKAHKILELADRNIPPQFSNIIQRMHAAWRHLARPNGIAFGFQDGQGIDLHAKLHALPEKLLTEDDYWFLNRTGAPPREHNSLLENAGYAVLRTGWHSDALCVAFDGGPLGDNHQHEDKLSIQVYAAGKNLIGEAGTVDYADSPQRHYSLSSLGHSTAIIDGMGQNRRKHFTRTPLNAKAGLEADLTSDQPWVRATYDEGYGPEANRAVSHTRKVTLLNKRQIVLLDQFTASDNELHCVELLFHILMDEAHVADGHFKASNREGDSLTLEPSTASQTALEMVLTTGGFDPDLRGWASPDAPETGRPEAGTWLLVPRPCLTQRLTFHHQETVTTILTVQAAPA